MIKSNILAHRGFWLESAEKNTPVAFARAFEAGFGVETDVRDLDGRLVISHDPPTTANKLIFIDDFIDIYKSVGGNGWLAFNIKSDGLADMMAEVLLNRHISNYFVFDMSVPDMRGYLTKNMKVFTRVSDIERSPAHYESCQGVWLDSFGISHSPSELAQEYIHSSKTVALVSPELHRREHQLAWAEWREGLLNYDDKIMLCTDFPDKASVYFGDHL